MLIRTAFIFLFCFSLQTLKAEEPLLKSNLFLNTHLNQNSNVYSSFLLETDSIKKRFIPKDNKPKIAGFLSAALPSAGQFYNKKYWKIPLVVGVLGGIGYLIHVQNNTVKSYRDAILSRSDDNPLTIDPYINTYSTENLISLQDQARRNRDLFIIVFSLGYMLQIVDAVVDAHLATFDVSDDLSLKINPNIQVSNSRYYPSFTASFTFK